MTEVRTHEEALALTDQAVRAWAQHLTGVLAQASAVADGARSHAESVVSRRRVAVSAIEAKLSAADAERRRALEAQLVRAREAYEQARRASVRIADVAVAVRQLTRNHELAGVPQAAAVHAQLSSMTRAIENYRVGASTGGPFRSATRTAPRIGRSPVADLGMGEVAVSFANLAENPIEGEFGRGGATRADYRWAVQVWNDIVGPGVGQGATRDDFAVRDERNEAPPLRRLADVYDMFLGTDRIRVNRLADGSLNVINGRHRLQIASDLGIDSLPGEVT